MSIVCCGDTIEIVVFPAATFLTLYVPSAAMTSDWTPLLESKNVMVEPAGALPWYLTTPETSPNPGPQPARAPAAMTNTKCATNRVVIVHPIQNERAAAAARSLGNRTSRG